MGLTSKLQFPLHIQYNSYPRYFWIVWPTLRDPWLTVCLVEPGYNYLYKVELRHNAWSYAAPPPATPSSTSHLTTDIYISMYTWQLTDLSILLCIEHIPTYLFLVYWLISISIFVWRLNCYQGLGEELIVSVGYVWDIVWDIQWCLVVWKTMMGAELCILTPSVDWDMNTRLKISIS